ncbi:MAG: AhpC/TSA family protein [Prevotellaceae bacterium]|jgi:hypothetical protein|nr:AhpC/TSA family protein [Prevotellaceae bacterium]
MKIRTILSLLGLSTLFFGACQPASHAKIEGSFINFSNDTIALFRLKIDELVAVDTIITDSRGSFTTRVKMRSGFPEFYYLTHKGVIMSPLLVLPGDRISVKIDTAEHIYLISGSVESEYLREAELAMAKARHRYDSLMLRYVVLDKNSQEANAINYELGSIYVKQKQSAIRFLFNHPNSMASVHVLFQQFSDDLPLFAHLNDAIYFQRLYDSLKPLYPRSPFISALRDQSEWRRRQVELDEKLSNVQVLGFPDILLPDLQAKPVALSSLQGNVIVLSFWISQDARQRMANQELLELYKKYHPKGMVLYQVSLDVDKPTWARAVSEQALPWISVCDGLGIRTPAVSTYAVTQTPTLFLIDQAGDIVGRDFTTETLAKELAKLFRF